MNAAFNTGDIIKVEGSNTLYKVIQAESPSGYPFARQCDSEGNIISKRQLGSKAFEANKVAKA